MLKQINLWMEPPIFEGDEEKTSQVRIINTLILYLATALLVVIFFLIPIFAFQKIGSWIFSGSVFCVLVAGRHFIFQGRVRFGIILIFSVLYLCILAMLILSGGASNTAMFYFATVVLVAGFFLESHIVNAFTIPTFLAAMAVTLLQDYGLVALPKIFVFSSAFSWIATGLGLLFMIRTRNLFVGNLNDAIEIARRTNAEIRAAEARYRVVVEHGGLGVVFMTAGRRIEYASLAYQKILGYSPQEMVGHLDMEFVHPDDLEFAEKRYCELLEKPDGYVSWEYRLQRKDGSYCWVETTAVNLLDDPNVRAIVLNQHDIDERKNAEEALRVSEDQFRAFVEQAPVAIGVFDFDGIGIYANQKFLDMLGLRTIDDVVGRPAYEYFASQFREASKERTRRRALGLPVPTEFESIAVRSNGQEFPVLLTVAPIQVSNGITSIAFVDDITVRKRAEVETAQKNKQLTMLNQLSRELNKLAPLPEILDRISDLIGQVFDNRNLYIALYDETSNYISFPIYWVDGENKSPVAGRPLSKGLTEFIIRKRTPILITDHMDETLAELGIDLIGTPSKCYLGVPVMIDGRGIGVIAVQDYERDHAYSSENIELLETIAFQAAIAIENARLYEASQ